MSLVCCYGLVWWCVAPIFGLYFLEDTCSSNPVHYSHWPEACQDIDQTPRGQSWKLSGSGKSEWCFVGDTVRYRGWVIRLGGLKPILRLGCRKNIVVPLTSSFCILSPLPISNAGTVVHVCSVHMDRFCDWTVWYVNYYMVVYTLYRPDGARCDAKYAVWRFHFSSSLGLASFCFFLLFFSALFLSYSHLSLHALGLQTSTGKPAALSMVFSLWRVGKKAKRRLDGRWSRWSVRQWSGQVRSCHDSVHENAECALDDMQSFAI